MTTLIINDLQESTVLDSNAMAGVRGGYTAMANSLVTTMGPAKGPGKGLKMHKPLGFPTTLVRKDLTNISEQLNIAVGSAGVMQANSNSVSQY